MCGIAGIVDFSGAPPSPQRLQRALHCLAPRGPDDRGTWIAPAGRPAVGLAHTRLAVIGPGGAGRQPLSDPEGRYRIVFNGTIYNYPQLKTELQHRGHCFVTRTDTEVLLHGYMHWGEEVFQRLSGMWACAIYDAQDRRGVLCRDRFGIKPLVYGLQGSELVFASDLKTLESIAAAQLTIDPAGLAEFVRCGWILHPRTIYEQCRRLPPGHVLGFGESGADQPRRYYRVQPAEPAPADEAEAVVRLRTAISSSVRSRCIADVPLGAFLSGGLDSSIVVRELAQVGAGRLQTFSIGYPDQPRYDESRRAQEVASAFGTRHHAIMLGFGEVLQALPRLLDDLGEPFADASYVPSALLAEHTRRHVTVALSGDGGDELFGGYRRYLAHHAWARYMRQPAGVRAAVRAAVGLAPASKSSFLGERLRRVKKLLRASSDQPLQRHWMWSRILTPEGERLLDPGGRLEAPGDPQALCGAALGPELLQRTAGDWMNQVLLLDLHGQLPADMLHKVDLAGMRSALEVRVPLLDPAVVELATAMPSSWKIRGARGKHILKKAYAADLPPAVLRGPKMGFELPIGEFLRGPLRAMFMDVVTRDVVDTLPPLSHDGIQELYRQHCARRDDHADVLYAMLVLCWWRRKH